MHPHVIVSSSLQRLSGARQARTCVVLRPLPEAASLPEVTHAVDDVVGLSFDFQRVDFQHVTPNSQLEEAMLEAAHGYRSWVSPPLSAAAAWNQLAPGIPRAVQ